MHNTENLDISLISPPSGPLLERVLAASRDVISLVDLDGTCLYVSPACQHLLGYTPEEMVGLDGFAHVHPHDLPIARAALARLVLTGQAVTAQFRMIRKSGTDVWVEASALPPPEGQSTLAVGIRDITERREFEELLLHAALHDPVTGLPNRRLLDEDLTAAVARSERSGLPLAVLFIDLNGFKALNDSYGHAAGDRVLRTVAERLDHSVRTGDIAARYAGDEFVVVMLDVADRDLVETQVERVRAGLAEPHLIEGRPVTVTASIGVAVWRPGTRAEQLLAEADQEMYRDKHG